MSKADSSKNLIKMRKKANRTALFCVEDVIFFIERYYFSKFEFIWKNTTDYAFVNYVFQKWQVYATMLFLKW